MKTTYQTIWRENGRAFNVPECCIDFFCEHWVPHVNDAERVQIKDVAGKLRRGALGIVKQIGDARVAVVYITLAKWAGSKAGVIPCPNCLSKLLGKKFKRGGANVTNPLIEREKKRAYDRVIEYAKAYRDFRVKGDQNSILVEQAAQKLIAAVDALDTMELSGRQPSEYKPPMHYLPRR